MQGVLLCKFDENKGYVPIQIYPSKLNTKDNRQIFRDIAKNAIGFGTSIEYNQFIISDVHVISRRFTRKVSNARGGVEIFSLALLSMEEKSIDRAIIENYTKRIIEDWENRSVIIKEFYKEIFKTSQNDLIDIQLQSNQINYQSDTTILMQPNKKKKRKKEFTKSILFNDEIAMREKDNFFAFGNNPPRNILMLVGMLLIILILAFGYDFISFLIMVNFGVLLFSFINNRKRPMRISVGILSIFIVYMIIGLIFQIFYGISFLIQPTFPDVLIQPHWALLSILSGFFICIGLDRGKKIDKISTIIGLIFIIIDILIFIVVPFLLKM
ncbi:MAG: hypothetical protein ACTSPY_11635 [Candidatus Helarchaeota archaeon]